LRKKTIGIAFAAAILSAAFGLAGTGAANAESVMKVCGDQWKQAKANGTTNGLTWKDFLAKCREEQKAGAAAPAAAPPPAPAAAAPAAAAAAGGKTAKECNAEYAANKDAIKASGQKKKDFVAACRAGTETVPPAAAAAPAPAPAAAPAPAPQPTTTTSAPAAGGTAGHNARIKECGQRWKQAKANNTTNGLKWPQFWHQCDEQLKAAGQ
jgi:hypothetical protein